MYHLFMDGGVGGGMRIPGLLRQAPCEGVAQVSFVAADEGDEMSTLVMGSPLYIRVCPLGAAPVRNKRRWWQRLARSRQ